MAIKIADRFSEQCSVVTNNSYDTFGTITRSSIEYMTPAELEAAFVVGGLYADLEAFFQTAIEMKACGTRTYGLYDWIMSGADRQKGRALLSIQKNAMNPSFLFPFIMGKQDSVINSDFWAITAGWLNSGYTPTGSPEPTGPLVAGDLDNGVAGDRVIRVVTRYGLDMDEKWFLNKDLVHIFSRASGVTEDGQWKVLASAVATDKTYVDVLITSQNGGSDAPFDASPTAGVLVAGINNVNDFESYCQNRPNYDGRKMVPFWFSTNRRTRKVDQQYKEWFARLKSGCVNRAFKEFGDLDLAQRNKQDELNWQKRWVNAFFLQKSIGTNQTLANWKNLENITTPTGFSVDPGTGGRVVTKRANFVGVKEQLRQCGRYKDLANQPLNLIEFFDDLYNIQRSRETNGGNVSNIDVYTNSVMAVYIQQAFMSYYKTMYLDQLRINMELGQNEKLGIRWNSYFVQRPAGVRINIITHPHFDDWLSANSTEDQDSVGNSMLILDLGKGGIYWSQLASNRKTHKVGELAELAKIDKDFACVLESFVDEVTMSSETGTVIVECPSNSLWIEGIALAQPVVSGINIAGGSTASDLY